MSPKVPTDGAAISPVACSSYRPATGSDARRYSMMPAASLLEDSPFCRVSPKHRMPPRRPRQKPIGSSHIAVLNGQEGR